MQTFYIFIGITGLILLAVLILVSILLFRQRNKRRTSIRIIKPNNRIRTKNFYGSVSERFSVDGNEYIYDHKCEVKRGFGVDVFYFEGVATPIRLDEIEKTVSITSKNLHDLLKNDLIEKLFNNDKTQEQLKILMILTLIAVVGVLLVVFVYHPAISLADNPQNQVVIENAIRNVLR